MGERIIKPTEAYSMLLENVSSVLDCKEQGIASGVLASDMDDLEAINWLNSLALWNSDFDRMYSPGIYNGFLAEYCKPEFSEGLKHFYPQLAAREGVYLPNEIWDTNTFIMIDVYNYAEKTKQLGGKEHWGFAFNARYLEHWQSAFSGKRSSVKKPSFFKRWIGSQS